MFVCIANLEKGPEAEPEKRRHKRSRKDQVIDRATSAANAVDTTLTPEGARAERLKRNVLRPKHLDDYV